MKNIILFLICLVVNITASAQVRVVFDGTPYGMDWARFCNNKKADR